MKVLIETITNLDTLTRLSKERDVPIDRYRFHTDEEVQAIFLRSPKLKWIEEHIKGQVLTHIINGKFDLDAGPFRSFAYMDTSAVKPYELFVEFLDPKDAVYYKVTWGND